MPEQPGAEPVTREDMARVEGKIDAYASVLAVRVDEHDRRLAEHDSAFTRVHADIEAVRNEAMPKRVSGWTAAGVIIAGLVGIVSIGAVLITMIQALSRAGGG